MGYDCDISLPFSLDAIGGDELRVVPLFARRVAISAISLSFLVQSEEGTELRITPHFTTRVAITTYLSPSCWMQTAESSYVRAEQYLPHVVTRVAIDYDIFVSPSSVRYNRIRFAAAHVII